MIESKIISRNYLRVLKLLGEGENLCAFEDEETAEKAAPMAKRLEEYKGRTRSQTNAFVEETKISIERLEK